MYSQSCTKDPTSLPSQPQYQPAAMPTYSRMPSFPSTIQHPQMGQPINGVVAPSVVSSAPWAGFVDHRMYQQLQPYQQPPVAIPPQPARHVFASKPSKINTLGHSQTIFIWKRMIKTDGILLCTRDDTHSELALTKRNLAVPAIIELYEEFTGTQEFGDSLRANPLQKIDEVSQQGRGTDGCRNFAGGTGRHELAGEALTIRKITCSTCFRKPPRRFQA